MNNFLVHIRYGLYATAVLMLLSLLSLIILGTSPDTYDIGAIIGYTSIILSLVFVYLGIKRYRDTVLDGRISFLQALKTGMLISLFPAATFGVYNLIYIEFIDPDFIETYYQYQLEQLENELSVHEFAIARQKMEQEKEFFTNTSLQFGVMFFTVWVIGFIVSIVSSIPLTKKKIESHG